VHDVAVGVAQHLHLDVARVLDVALDVEAPVAEIALALAAARSTSAFSGAASRTMRMPCRRARRRLITSGSPGLRALQERLRIVS